MVQTLHAGDLAALRGTLYIVYLDGTGGVQKR